MAPVSERQKKCLEMTLECLEEKRGHMHSAVDDYVNKVIGAGKQWTESEDVQKPAFLVMFQKIDSAVEYFCSKHTELSESDKCSIQTTTDTPLTRQESNVDLALRKKNEEEVKKLTAKIDEMQNLASELQSLKEQQQKLSNIQDNLQDEMSSRIKEDLDRKFTIMHNETKDFVMSTLDENGSYLDAISLRTDSLEKITTDLSDKMRTNQEMFENVLILEERNEMAIKDIQEKLVLIEPRALKCTRIQSGVAQTNVQELAGASCQTNLLNLEKRKKLIVTDSRRNERAEPELEGYYFSKINCLKSDKNKPTLNSVPKFESFDHKKEMDTEVAPKKPSSEEAVSRFIQYDRAYLMKLRNSLLSLKKPEGLPDEEEIILDVPLANTIRGTSVAPLDFPLSFFEPYTNMRQASPFRQFASPFVTQAFPFDRTRPPPLLAQLYKASNNEDFM